MKILKNLLILLPVILISTTPVFALQLNLTGFVYFSNNFNSSWSGLQSVNVSVYNTSTTIITSNTTSTATDGSFSISNINGTNNYTAGANLNITFTFPAWWAGGENVDLTLRNINITQNANATLNFTLRIVGDKTAGVSGEGLKSTNPTLNTSMVSTAIIFKNESLTTQPFNISGIFFSMPTSIPYSPSVIGICTQSNNSINLSANQNNLCNNNTNLWTYRTAGISYTVTNVSNIVPSSLLGGLVNETAIVAAFWPSTVNSEPKFEVGFNVSVRSVNWGQLEPNYSSPAPLVFPNFTQNGTFLGMTLASNTYAPLSFLNDMFFKFPTKIESLAYNLTFNVTFNQNGTKVINISIPEDPTQPLYKNQTLIPATWFTFSPSVFMANGTAPPNMTILMKRPDNFTIEIINLTGTIGSQNITGAFNGTNASFKEGKVILNLSGTAGDKIAVRMLMGLQDRTCFENAVNSSGFFNDTLFNSQCFQQGLPPKFESSPVLIVNQSIGGTFNPFAQTPGDAPPLNFNGTTVFVVNVTNPLLNYTGDKIFVDFRIPKNATMCYNANCSNNQTTNMTRNANLSWLNTTSGIWNIINATTTPYANITDGCINITNSFTDFGGSANITMCFSSFAFNLNQTVSPGIPNGWIYNANASLNISMDVGWSIVNKTQNAPGTAGSTNQVNLTVSGGEGSFKLNDTDLPGFSSATPSSVTVTVNNKTYTNFTLGSLILSSPGSGVNVISVSYSIAAAAPPPSSGGGGGGGGLPTPLNVTVQRGNATIAVPLIAAGKMANVTIEKVEDVSFRQLNISVVNSVNAISIFILKLPQQPAEVTQTVSGNVYHFINVSKFGFRDSDIANASIRFAVPKSWLIANNIDPNTIVLNRFTTFWSTLPTTKVSETTDEISYDSESPGLSIFAISGQSLPPSAQPTQPTEVPQAPPQPAPRGPDFTVIIIVIVIVAVLGLLAVYEHTTGKLTHVMTKKRK